jgi:hypothetical protein
MIYILPVLLMIGVTEKELHPNGFRIESGMTEWGRTNSGSFSARHSGHTPGKLSQLSFSRPSPRSRIIKSGTGVHVERLKVTGDILPLPEGLPPSRSDEMDSPDQVRGRLWSSPE